MKTRILRVIWLISVLWLALIIYGGTFGTAKDELALNLLVFGWPGAVGLLICYFVVGSFLWPVDPNAINDPVQPIRTIDLDPPKYNFESQKSSKQQFLSKIKESKQAVAASLAIEKQAMLDEWESKYGDQIEKFEQAKLTIRESNVIDALTNIIKETVSWNHYLECELKDELTPKWISTRLFPIDRSSKETVEFESFNEFSPNQITKELGTLDDCLGLNLDDLHIEIFTYKLAEDSSYTRHGRAQVFVNSECVLEIAIEEPLSSSYWGWSHEIFVAKPELWITSIINLNEEIKGRAELEGAAIKLREKQFLIDKGAI